MLQSNNVVIDQLLVPSILLFSNARRRFEGRANRWCSVRQAPQGVDTMHLILDRRAASFPRAFGWVIAVGALFIIGDCAILLSSLH